MTIVNINAGEDDSRYVAQVYQEQYARLRRYFLVQLSDCAEAEGCVHETIRHLFFFMEDHDWETEKEYIPVYIMRIAGLVCSRKLSEKNSAHEARLANENNGLLNRVRVEASRTIKERVEFSKLCFGLLGRDGGYPSKA